MSIRTLLGRVRRAVRERSPLELIGLAGARWRSAFRRRRGGWEVGRRLIEKEREWDVPFGLRTPRWWRHGFLSRSAILYDLERNDPSLYISDWQRYRSTKRMVHPRIQDLINNKMTTHLLLRSLDVPSAELLGVYWRGAVHRFPGEERVPLKDFLAGLEDGRRVFVKPFSGAEGKRLYSVRRTGDRFRMNGQDLAMPAVRAAIEAEKRPMVVEGGIEQHPDQRALYPETTNTVRLLTMLDMSDRSPFVVAAAQRIGSARSGHVDNWTAGGLSASIDLETGRLGPATRLPDDRRLQWFDHHPDTGVPVRGVQVPFWEETRATIEHAARVLSFMEYIGWDIIITASGPVVLEANINSGMNVLQAHGPLLADPRARVYFAKRGVVPAAGVPTEDTDA